MKTIWTETVYIPEQPHLPGNLTTDIAVIGGGLAGILTAFYLAQAGKDVIVLEANRIGQGQTGGTTAKITSQHGLIYQHLTKTMGNKTARLYAAANQQAIQEYRRLIHDRSIFCDFKTNAACLYTTSRKELLQKELTAAREAGISAQLEFNTELPFPVEGALYFPDQAQFHPRKFLAAVAYPLTIYEHTPVLSLKRSGSQSMLYTPHGKVIAKQVVFACHYPFPLIPGFYFAKMYQKRSYVLQLEYTGQLKHMYLGIDPDGLSFRQIDQQLLLGGCGHRSGKSGANHGNAVNPYEKLSDTARRLYPEAIIRGHWSAQDCMTLDHVPYIGTFSSRTPNWYVATGFQKWGMTSSMVAALLLTDVICGRKTPFLPVFAPNRFTPRASASELAVHMLESAKGLSAGLFCRTPRCPHMGCKLEWNSTDEAWECPCHGSRFDELGHLESGPAQTDISGHRL